MGGCASADELRAAPAERPLLLKNNLVKEGLPAPPIACATASMPAGPNALSDTFYHGGKPAIASHYNDGSARAKRSRDYVVPVPQQDGPSMPNTAVPAL